MSITRNIDRFVSRNSLRPADVIVVEKNGAGILDHYVVYLGVNHHGNQIFVANMIGTGVRVLNRSELSQLGVKYIPTRIRRFQGTEFEREKAIQRALNDLGEGYNLLTHNCETYANHVQKDRKYSSQAQVGGVLLGAALIGLFGWLMSDDE